MTECARLPCAATGVFLLARGQGLGPGPRPGLLRLLRPGEACESPAWSSCADVSSSYSAFCGGAVLPSEYTIAAPRERPQTSCGLALAALCPLTATLGRLAPFSPSSPALSSKGLSTAEALPLCPVDRPSRRVQHPPLWSLHPAGLLSPSRVP